MYDLNTLYANVLPTGFTLVSANDINDNGWITGYGTNAAGDIHGFLVNWALAGDANLDGKVDINDLSRVLTNYDKTGTSGATGDFNGDGKVDINDLSIVLTNYDHSLGSSAFGAAAVPEPGGAGASGRGRSAGFAWQARKGY